MKPLHVIQLFLLWRTTLTFRRLPMYASSEEDFNFSSYGVDDLEKVLKQASYTLEQADQVQSEYMMFK